MANPLPGCRLFEIDFSAIEALLTGWFCRDPEYMRLARLGVHGALSSLVLGSPYDPAAPDKDLAALFKAVKEREPLIYDRSKRTVYGDLYGLTEYGMVKNFPETYPTLKVAREYKAHLHKMAPAVPQFQADVRTLAYDLNYLGGTTPPAPGYSNRVAQVIARNPNLAIHPFGYKHWFWAVLGFRQVPYSVYLKRQKAGEPVTEIQGKFFAVTLGDDAKRVVAFFPQSTAAGCLKEAMLRLFDPEHPSYIGDAYYGRTPLRAPIHDSLLLEIPVRVWDYVVECCYREMMRPIPELPMDWVPVEVRQRMGFGSHLSIGVEGKASKVGGSWREMTKLPSPTLEELGVAGDSVLFAHEEGDDEDEVVSLGTVA